MSYEWNCLNCSDLGACEEAEALDWECYSSLRDAQAHHFCWAHSHFRNEPEE